MVSLLADLLENMGKARSLADQDAIINLQVMDGVTQFLLIVKPIMQKLLILDFAQVQIQIDRGIGLVGHLYGTKCFFSQERDMAGLCSSNFPNILSV